jgi:hypothetical protein
MESTKNRIACPRPALLQRQFRTLCVTGGRQPIRLQRPRLPRHPTGFVALFANAYELDDGIFYDALVRMFKQAVTMPWHCPRQARNHFSIGSAK